MFFTIEKDVLLRGLVSVSRALSSKPLNPIFSGIKFEVTKNHLTLTATDNDLTILVELSAFENEREVIKIQNKGSYILPGKQIVDLIKTLNTESIEFKQITNKDFQEVVKIKSGRSTFTLQGYSGEHYPNIFAQLTEPSEKLKIEKKEFRNLMKQSLPFASTSMNRPILMGIHLELLNNQWTCTSTDNFRLSQTKLPFSNSNLNLAITIPTKAMQEMLKILPTNNSELTLHFFKEQLIIEDGPIRICSRLLYGDYPDVTNFIPSKFSNQITINRLELIKAAERVSLIVEGNPHIFLSLEKNQPIIKLKSRVSPIGHAADQITGLSNAHESLCIMFDAVFLKDALQTLDSENVLLEFNSDMKPFIIREPNSTESIRLIVPVRMEE